ncbi:TATA-box-binding protein [Halopiger aswanensis]|uniref:TATA binding protein of transcription factor TFIID n=1 Tax=Halopiger aswanensis TaxID=148449 RepID=A0A3R7EBT1_9EURY|nr:transcription factor [Halopiger aswanensis]RKD87667.1 TATA binding protein of transcription factor TFIID [Halopiger aswanensis]
MAGIKVVNIVGLGNLQSEVDIEVLAADAPLPVSNYDPKFNASFFRFEEDGELVILYTSGKYILRGGDEFEIMYAVNERFLGLLEEMGVEVDAAELEIKNVVAVGNLGHEVDLNALTIELGIEDVEYEPEQFPGLVYRPDGTNCVLLVFGSGKVVITGGRTRKEDKDAFTALEERIKQSALE